VEAASFDRTSQVIRISNHHGSHAADYTTGGATGYALSGDSAVAGHRDRRSGPKTGLLSGPWPENFHGRRFEKNF